jgi:hypothetical protein
MRLSLQQQVIQLVENQPLAFRGARGVDIECTAGRVWLTVDGQPGDFFLARGERLRIASDGLALVEGLPAGAVRLLRQTPWPLRWARSLRQALRMRLPRTPGSGRLGIKA